MTGVATQMEPPPAGEPDCANGRAGMWTSLTSPLTRDFVECVLHHDFDRAGPLYPGLACNPVAPFAEGLAALRTEAGPSGGPPAGTPSRRAA